MNRCSFCEWIPILPWPLWPLAGQFSLGQNVVVGSMTLLLAVRGKHCHEKYVWTPVGFTTAPYHGLVWSYLLSPLLSNLYLTAVDRMLEQAKEVTRRGPYTYLEYARFADDLVILVDAYPQHDWLLKAVDKRLREELATLQVAINEEKSRLVDLAQ